LATILPLFLDEGAPRSVGRFFAEQDHAVTYMQDVMASGSADPLVAEVAQRNAAILVAIDKDMRQLAKDRGVGSQRFRRLHLLQLRCAAVQAVHRVREAYSLIEHEWALAQTKEARRFWVEIGTSYIRTHR
jgi:predicted nuclease of predicted toxin-antitoxin system